MSVYFTTEWYNEALKLKVLIIVTWDAMVSL